MTCPTCGSENAEDRWCKCCRMVPAHTLAEPCDNEAFHGALAKEIADAAFGMPDGPIAPPSDALREALKGDDPIVQVYSVLRRMAVVGQTSEALNRLIDEGDSALDRAVEEARRTKHEFGTTWIIKEAHEEAVAQARREGARDQRRRVVGWIMKRKAIGASHSDLDDLATLLREDDDAR